MIGREYTEEAQVGQTPMQRRRIERIPAASGDGRLARRSNERGARTAAAAYSPAPVTSTIRLVPSGRIPASSVFWPATALPEMKSTRVASGVQPSG